MIFACSTCCGDTFIHACGSLVSATRAVQGHFFGIYHNQRDPILAKVGPGRSLVHIVRRLKLGCFGMTFGCWITGGISRHIILSEQSRLRGPLRLPVRRRSTPHTTSFSFLLYSDKQASHGELLTLKSEVPQSRTQRPYPRSSLLVLQIFGANIENRVCADTTRGHFPSSPALVSLLPGPVFRS